MVSVVAYRGTWGPRIEAGWAGPTLELRKRCPESDAHDRQNDQHTDRDHPPAEVLDRSDLLHGESVSKHPQPLPGFACVDAVFVGPLPNFLLLLRCDDVCTPTRVRPQHSGSSENHRYSEGNRGTHPSFHCVPPQAACLCSAAQSSSAESQSIHASITSHLDARPMW